MPVPQTLTPDLDPCGISARWMISQELAERLQLLAGMLPFQIQIISGWRDRETQEKLIREGKGAPDVRSTHRSCPATGADLWPLVAVAPQIQIEFGRNVQLVGLRWGGGSPVDPQTGIPADWNHVDLGPRAP